MRTQAVTRTATCKRCGSTTVTWLQNDAGKWYLTEVFNWSMGDEPNERTDHTDFHSKYCGKDVAHLERQREIFQNLMRENDEREADHERREAERIEAEAEKLAAWYRSTPSQRTEHIARLEREIARTLDGITMDYFVEWSRAQTHAAALRAEIDMYEADEADKLDN